MAGNQRPGITKVKTPQPTTTTASILVIIATLVLVLLLAAESATSTTIDGFDGRVRLSFGINAEGGEGEAGDGPRSGTIIGDAFVTALTLCWTPPHTQITLAPNEINVVQAEGESFEAIVIAADPKTAWSMFPVDVTLRVQADQGWSRGCGNDWGVEPIGLPIQSCGCHDSAYCINAGYNTVCKCRKPGYGFLTNDGDRVETSDQDAKLPCHGQCTTNCLVSGSSCIESANNSFTCQCKDSGMIQPDCTMSQICKDTANQCSGYGASVPNNGTMRGTMPMFRAAHRKG